MSSAQSTEAWQDQLTDEVANAQTQISNSVSSAVSTASNRLSSIQSRLKESAEGIGERLKQGTTQGRQAVQASVNSWRHQLPETPSFLAAEQKGLEGNEAQTQAEDRPWKRRIAGLSSHLLAPFHWDSASQMGLIVSPEVSSALREGQAVVALESTIISHGMPYPQNLETAQAVERVVRENGAVPATVAVIGGTPHVGLTPKQLEHIAKSGAKTRKTSRRDLPFVMANNLDGATTVSATMLLACRAGIPVFVTGGIGGVHRGGESSMDISSDLTEFSRSPIAVVCAGVKSILDIPRTLEYLETQGVCVAAYQTDEFPAFFTPHSSCKAPSRVESPQEAAQLIHASQQLALNSGVLIGVPIPPKVSAEGQQMEEATQQALRESEQKGLSGAETTPFLLKRIQELSHGKSLEANIALIKNNALVGSQIACAVCHASRK